MGGVSEMKEVKTYEIEKITDLLKIPKNRRRAFIAEMPRLFEHLELTVIHGIKLAKLVWRDDGKQTDTITISVVGGAG
jgi:hypothetical protein